MKSFRSLFILIILSGVLVLSWWMYQGDSPQDQSLVNGSSLKIQTIQEDWISYQIPELLQESSYDLKMELLEQVDELSVQWSHPATGALEEHLLEKFVMKSRNANYRINSEFGNLLPGLNHFEITAKRSLLVDDQERVDVFKSTFDLVFDLAQLDDYKSELIQMLSFPDITDTNEVDFVGKLKVAAEKMQAFSYSPKTGFGTFSVLNRYKSGSFDFDYHAKESYNNLQSGDNWYVFEAYDVDDQLISRSRFSLVSTRLTLQEEVENLFGSFTRGRGGWYTSTTLPWFLFRPVYEDVLYQTQEGMLTFARPSFLYSAESYIDVNLCDYLSDTNYESKDILYRGYSYETCQEYSRGVSLYERFLSAMTWEAVMTIPKDLYKDVAERTSSAFVMIETAGMKKKPVSLAADVSTEGTGFNEHVSDENLKKKPLYFVMQMLITQDSVYDEKKIGDVQEELTEGRRAVINQIREFLSAHPAELLFAEYLDDFSA